MKVNLKDFPRLFETRAAREIRLRALESAQTVVKWTAWDVQKSAKASIKAGGKSQKSKAWKVSAPGEAPRSHRGNLKQGVRVGELSPSSYIVGAEKEGNGTALNALEFGGQTSAKSTFYADDYVRRARRAHRKSSKPATARPYALASAMGAEVTIRRYIRFYSAETCRRATRSASFQHWAAAQRATREIRFVIKARPYMGPALKRETTSQKVAARVRRARRNFKKGR